MIWDYDNWKAGDYDSNSPVNQKDDEQEETNYETLYDAYNSNDLEVFEEMYCGIANELKIVYEALKATDHELTNKVRLLIEKMQ